jgi:hypothetical protein
MQPASTASSAGDASAAGIDGCAGDVVAAALGLGGPVVQRGHGLDALIARHGAERLRQLAGLLLIAPCPL